jgi:hypothetical protein
MDTRQQRAQRHRARHRVDQPLILDREDVGVGTVGIAASTATSVAGGGRSTSLAKAKATADIASSLRTHIPTRPSFSPLAPPAMRASMCGLVFPATILANQPSIDRFE